MHKLRGMDTFTQILITIEDFFNRAGYWPIISSITGSLRIVFGFFVAVIGFKLMVGSIVGVIFANTFATKKLTATCFKFARHSVRVMTNGRLNVLRGSVEVVPFFGNAAVWLYDRGRKNALLLPYHL